MSRFREPFSGLTHLVGAVLALGGLIWLIAATWNNTPLMISMIVYGVSLIALYTSSTMLHLIRAPKQIEYWLNRLDHAAIYVLIAGSYTPFCYALLTGAWRWGMLGGIWAVALAGIAYKLFAPWKRDTRLSTIIYVAMGWISLIMLPQLIRVIPLSAILLVAAGGITYTVGAVVYALDNPESRPPFSYHDAWHIFVMLGSCLHFIAVLHYLT